MMKKAFVFPGQGAQKVGMVKDLYDAYPVVKQLFEEADDALGFSLTKLCFEGPDEELMKTYNTHPAILTASTACCRVLAQEGLTPDIAAGHSLGEYSALVAAGALTFADAVRTVRLRGQFMQEAVPLGEGGMAAILGLAEDKIKEICAQISAQGGTVQAVNFNCPGQIVIAGSTKAVEEAAAAMKEAGAKRAILLHVSAPFHSTLMEPAAKRLAEVLDDITISDAKIPVVANVNGQIRNIGCRYQGQPGQTGCQPGPLDRLHESHAGLWRRNLRRSRSGQDFVRVQPENRPQNPQRKCRRYSFLAENA